MLDLKKIKYLCSDTMKPYLDEISIDDRTKWEVNDLILLEFLNKDIKP